MLTTVRIYNGDLFAQHVAIDPIIPVKPRALAHHEWPPDYAGVYAWRLRTIAALEADPRLLESAHIYYETHPAEFIMHWMDTFDPRKVKNKWMPFVFFERQYEMVQFLEDCRTSSRNGLMEKCRDAGATWVSCGYSVWAWLKINGMSIGWGSRKESLVDKLGDADSIFEKMRLIISKLPRIFQPKGWSPRTHATYMKLINPENGATISGEAGDNIGRGGRKTMYFKDEAQPFNARVLTPHGYKFMAALHVGDYVVGSNGKPTRITAINDCGFYDVYRVELTDGTFAEATANHKWTVERRGKVCTKTTTELLSDYRYDSPGGQTKYIYRLPIAATSHFMAGDPLPLDPYVVGVLLGDGKVGGVPSDCPSFTSIDNEIVENVRRVLPEGVIVTNTPDSIAYRIVDDRGRQGNKPDKRSRARQAVVDAGIAGMRSHNKRIPDVYLMSSAANRLSVLQGLMDTDGSAANGGMPTFHTSSPALADGVEFIVRSLGGVASRSVKPDPRGFKDQIVVYVRLPDQYWPFRLGRKNAAIQARKQQVTRTIKSIELVGQRPTRCITVDAPDGLYLTDDFIVTHNSAHYERPEKIEAALGDNTNVQIDISSVNGLGNVFHRRRESGYEWYEGHDAPKDAQLVFIMDWSHHPDKTKEWYEARKEKAIREGMQHLFAQEVDRDYSAAISNTIIAYEWIQAAVDAHLNIPYLASIEIPDVWSAGLDVADEGEDRNALTMRQWIILRSCEEWGERDPGVSCRRTIAATRQHRGIKVQYDSIGVGSAVKSEYNRLMDAAQISEQEVKLVPWNAGAGVMWPYERVIPDDDLTPLNRDMFANFKAQAWWAVRQRFYKTWRALKEGVIYDPEELISLDSRNPLLHQIMKELAQPTKGESTGLRMVVNKKPNGMKSPNLADSAIQAFFPAPDDGGHALVGSYGGNSKTA